MNTRALIVTAIVALSPLTALAASSGRQPQSTASTASWELMNDRNGVQTWGIDADDDGFVSFKGVSVIDAAIDDVVTTMKDDSTAHNWMPMVAARRALRQISEGHSIEYMHMKMPWPCTDRYFIEDTHIETLPEGGVAFVIESIAKPEAAWLDADKVLATFRHSEFRLRPVEDGKKTELVFEVVSAAGGSVPTWLVSLAQQSWPHDFVVGLRAELTRRGKLGSQLAQGESH
jgi:hypothetical protein